MKSKFIRLWDQFYYKTGLIESVEVVEDMYVGTLLFTKGLRVKTTTGHEYTKEIKDVNVLELNLRRILLILGE